MEAEARDLDLEFEVEVETDLKETLVVRKETVF